MSIIQDHSDMKSATKVIRQPYLPVEDLRTSYLLSPQNRIVDLGGDWDKFAWANDGFEATADNVIGRNLAEFVSGFETVSFFNAISFNCRRTEQAFEMISRCDSPKLINLFRMRICPAKDGNLEVSNSLLMSRLKPIKPTLARTRTRIDSACCSMCGSYRRARMWVDALTEPELDFHASHYAVCSDCKERARAALQRSCGSVRAALRVVS